VQRFTSAALAAVAALTAAACSGGPVVNTGDTSAPTGAAASTAPPTTRPNNFNLVNAHDYFANSDGRAGYYFTTPSGRWRCAILPRSRAGCQSTSSPKSSMGIPGEPETVVNAQGVTHTPNAIVVEGVGDAHFAWLEREEFTLVPGPANALQFNKILAAAGFRCNVQEAGVSCLSESTGKGFTFSAEGYTLQYTDVPGNASS
jgi:hypothetical protein